MNKALPATLTVLALAAAGAAVYVTQKPRLDARTASVTSGYLPAQTLLLFSVPDPGQTAEDWKTTDLYKIWTEPQVQAFFSKPLSKVPPNQEVSDTWEQLKHLNPKHLFLALTALDDKNNQPHLVGGFQFDGSPDDVNKLLTRAKDALRQHYDAGKADLQPYQGHSIETFETAPLDPADNQTLASAFDGKWYLVGNDVALLKSTLDHLDGRAPTGDATLEKDADFQAVGAKLPKDHATLVFVRPRPFFDKIYAFTTAAGQTVDPAQRAEAEKMKAIGATTRLEKGKLRDTLYTLAPGHKRSDARVAMNALSLTSADTLLYVASALNLPDHYDVPGSSPGSPGAMLYAGLGQFLQGLTAKGITLENFRAAFGRELTFQLDWPASGSQPSLVASLDVHDPAAAAKFADNLPGALAAAGEWQTSPANGLTLHTLTVPSVKVLSPAFTLTDKHLVLGLSATGVAAAASRDKTGGANFTSTQAYKDSIGNVTKGTDAVGYIDSKALFERTYGALKPMAALSSMMYPQASEYVEVGKLPDAETVSRHLSPIVYSQSSDDQGMLVESVGPVTFIQAEVGLGGVLGAAAVPVMKQFGLLNGLPGMSNPPGEDANDAPDNEPESTPASTP